MVCDLDTVRSSWPLAHCPCLSLQMELALM